MGNPTDEISSREEIASSSRPLRPVECLSCGENQIKPGRRYCSKECRQQMEWVLLLSKGLLKTFNARHAAFSFTRDYVVLDVLPAWSKEISRFAYTRTPGNKPAEDLKNLILQSGREWHHLVNNNNSKSYASLFLIKKNHNKWVDPDSIKPNRQDRPRLSERERSCLKILDLEMQDLSFDGHIVKIKSAYKRMAKLHHPDMGGDEQKFRQLDEAYKQMLLWAENPLYTCRKALRGCWAYDGFSNRWSPPL